MMPRKASMPNIVHIYELVVRPKNNPEKDFDDGSILRVKTYQS